MARERERTDSHSQKTVKGESTGEVREKFEGPSQADIAKMWEEATGGAITNPQSVEDTRGDVLEPETDRRLTPHSRAVLVAERDGIDYREAMQKVVDAMQRNGEIEKAA